MIKEIKKFFGRRINQNGQEVPDPTPVELPLGYKHPKPLDERIKMLIRSDLSEFANDHDFESWEEANDFDTGEEKGDFPDEDFAPNDPFVERAYQEEKKKESLKKAALASEAKDEPKPKVEVKS